MARAALRAAPGAVRVEWVTRAADLERYAGAWRELEAAVARRTALVGYDFLAAWYRHYEGDYGGTPLVGFAWRGGSLAGVAPLTIRRATVGRIPVTRVEFAPNDSIAGEFLLDDDRPDTAGLLIEALAETAAFDVACLNGFEPGSPVLHAVLERARARRLGLEPADHAYAMVDLRAGYEAYRRRLSAHYRRNLAQKARKIAAAGEAVGGIEPAATGADVDQAVARLIAVNEASYKLQGRPLAPQHRAFLYDVCRRFAARGMLSLPILTIGGLDAAYMLGIVERGYFYDVTLAYDEAFARLSPGAHLTQRTLERLAGLGVHTMISHGAHEYKQHWATRFVPQTRLYLFAPGLRASATRFLRFRLMPWWQRLDRNG